MTTLTKRVERAIFVPGFGLGAWVVAIDRAGVTMRRPHERRANALLLPWLNVHGTASRLRAEVLRRERAQRRALRRAGGSR